MFQPCGGLRSTCWEFFFPNKIKVGPAKSGAARNLFKKRGILLTDWEMGRIDPAALCMSARVFRAGTQEKAALQQEQLTPGSRRFFFLMQRRWRQPLLGKVSPCFSYYPFLALSELSYRSASRTTELPAGLLSFLLLSDSTRLERDTLDVTWSDDESCPSTYIAAQLSPLGYSSRGRSHSICLYI